MVFKKNLHNAISNNKYLGKKLVAAAHPIWKLYGKDGTGTS
jgi:hypothetical protein